MSGKLAPSTTYLDELTPNRQAALSGLWYGLDTQCIS